MSSGIYARAAVAINLNIRKIRELAGFKLKGINKSPLTHFLMVFIYSLTACVFQPWEFLTTSLSCYAAVFRQKSLVEINLY
ncbi:hypothetical protein [Nostoc sp. NZL]|uniref:hypothetical protein n=1 Tax=Nostoc sp. NZL TaxID=2650612 RepID=UPI001E5DE25A|nr:hypothetical protein [Nostoc sp. NZL]MBG1243568.1 hypothetical protein [Nostoc sp. NZL]